MVCAALAGCGDRPPVATGKPDGPCLDGAQQADVIAQRLAGGATSLGRAQAVALDPPFENYLFIVAAEVHTPDAAPTAGVWATGSWLGGARVMALDEHARRWSDWGSAIPADSPAGKQRSRMATRSEVDRARACVRMGL